MIGHSHKSPRHKIHSSHDYVHRQRQEEVVGVHLRAILMQDPEPHGPQRRNDHGPHEHRFGATLVQCFGTLHTYQTQRGCFQSSGNGPLLCSWTRCASLRSTTGNPSLVSISYGLCGSTRTKTASTYRNPPRSTSPRSMRVVALMRCRVRYRRAQ